MMNQGCMSPARSVSRAAGSVKISAEELKEKVLGLMMLYQGSLILLSYEQKDLAISHGGTLRAWYLCP